MASALEPQAHEPRRGRPQPERVRSIDETPDILTLIGLPSTRSPFNSLAALPAVSGLLKMIDAMPRLVPFWLYVSITFLTVPAAFVKYSYSQNNQFLSDAESYKDAASNRHMCNQSISEHTAAMSVGSPYPVARHPQLHATSGHILKRLRPRPIQSINQPSREPPSNASARRCATTKHSSGHVGLQHLESPRSHNTVLESSHV